MADEMYVEELVTKNLKVIDDEDRGRVVVGSTDNGQSGLGIIDEAGRQRAHIRVGRDGTSMSLNDANECPRISMMVPNRAATSLLLVDQHGKPRVRVAAEEHGSAVLWLGDEEGEPRLCASVEHNRPGIALFDGWSNHSGIHLLADYKEGNSIKIVEVNIGFTKLGVPTDGEPGLILHDQDEDATHTL